MKKIFAILTLATIVGTGFAAEKPSPALLKDKANFSKTELFEPREVFADKGANAALLRDYEARGVQARPASARRALLPELWRHSQGEVRTRIVP